MRETLCYSHSVRGVQFVEDGHTVPTELLAGARTNDSETRQWLDSLVKSTRKVRH